MKHERHWPEVAAVCSRNTPYQLVGAFPVFHSVWLTVFLLGYDDKSTDLGSMNTTLVMDFLLEQPQDVPGHNRWICMLPIMIPVVMLTTVDFTATSCHVEGAADEKERKDVLGPSSKAMLAYMGKIHGGKGL